MARLSWLDFVNKLTANGTIFQHEIASVPLTLPALSVFNTSNRFVRNLNVEAFRLLLALLILSVGLRFAIELFIPPREPFSVVSTEGGR